jgi:hypothetical protein
MIPVASHKTWQRLSPEIEAGPTLAIGGVGPKLLSRLAVTLAYADGQWLVEVRNGRALLGTRHPVRSAQAMSMLAQLEVPGLQGGVEKALATDQSEASRQVDRMRRELAELEAKLTGINEMVVLAEENKNT